MNGLGMAGEAAPVLLVLATLALLLFVIAGLRGRWWLWLLGYAVAIATLTAAFLLGGLAGPAEHDDPDQPSAADGVVGPGVAVTPHDPAAHRRTE